MDVEKLLLKCILLCCSTYLFGETITARYPDYDKMYTNDFSVFNIKTDTMGRIVEIASNNEAEGRCVVSQNGDEFTIEHTYQNVKTEVVIYTKNILLKGSLIQESNLKRIDDKTPFTYNSINNTISEQSVYNGTIRRIEKQSSAVISENKISGYIFLFSQGITYVAYRNKENIQWKLEYEKQNRGFKVYFSSQMGSIKNLRNYDRYTENVDIATDRLYCSDMSLNIINHIILETYSRKLAEVLFPLVFLEAPFQDNYWYYTASSFLKEPHATYLPENLAVVEGLPWASGKGFGIRDIITIRMPVHSQKTIMFYNGFQSAEKSYLFTQNSRAKKIRIAYKELGTEKEVMLADTPKAQPIDISDILRNTGETATMEIEILDVYPGEKYNDLCIQAIIPRKTEK